MLKEKQQNMKHIPSVLVGREAVGPWGVRGGVGGLEQIFCFHVK